MGETVLDWYKRLTAAQWGKGREIAARDAGVAYTPVHGSAGAARKASAALRSLTANIPRMRLADGRKRARTHEQRQAAAKCWRAARRCEPFPVAV